MSFSLWNILDLVSLNMIYRNRSSKRQKYTRGWPTWQSTAAWALLLCLRPPQDTHLIRTRWRTPTAWEIRSCDHHFHSKTPAVQCYLKVTIPNDVRRRRSRDRASATRFHASATRFHWEKPWATHEHAKICSNKRQQNATTRPWPQVTSSNKSLVVVHCI